MTGIYPIGGIRPSDERSTESVCQLPVESQNCRSLTDPALGGLGPLGLSDPSGRSVADGQTDRNSHIRQESRLGRHFPPRDHRQLGGVRPIRLPPRVCLPIPPGLGKRLPDRLQKGIRPVDGHLVLQSDPAVSRFPVRFRLPGRSAQRDPTADATVAASLEPIGARIRRSFGAHGIHRRHHDRRRRRRGANGHERSLTAPQFYPLLKVISKYKCAEDNVFANFSFYSSTKWDVTRRFSASSRRRTIIRHCCTQQPVCVTVYSRLMYTP